MALDGVGVLAMLSIKGPLHSGVLLEFLVRDLATWLVQRYPRHVRRSALLPRARQGVTPPPKFAEPSALANYLPIRRQDRLQRSCDYFFEPAQQVEWNLKP